MVSVARDTFCVDSVYMDWPNSRSIGEFDDLFGIITVGCVDSWSGSHPVGSMVLNICTFPIL